MIRGLILTILFLLSLIAAAIAFTPLGFILERSGAGSLGAGWAMAEGTALDGRISGVHVDGQPIGDVTLKLRPMSLLAFAPTYDVAWSGAGGNGRGVVKIADSAIQASELRLQHDISALEGLAPAVRSIGGTLRLSDGSIRLTRTGCEAAAGEITTDVLSRAADQYGRQFGMISGPVSCEEGAIRTDLAGQSERGDSVAVDARLAPTGESEFEVDVQTSDREVIFLLGQIGFAPRGDGYYYRYEDAGRLSQ